MADDGRLLDAEEKRFALNLARSALVVALTQGRLVSDTELNVPPSGPFRDTRAAFVTLKKSGNLRGCIGHVLPVCELWRSIRDNAVAAALNDHRFKPVEAGEIPSIELDISVLTVPVPVESYTGFVAGRHGVLMELGARRAVFLPQVAAEQGWDEHTTLVHLSMKAGLPPDAWKNPDAHFKVFEAQVFSESEFH